MENKFFNLEKDFLSRGLGEGPQGLEAQGFQILLSQNLKIPFAGFPFIEKNTNRKPYQNCENTMKTKIFKSGIVTLLIFVFLFPLTAHAGSSKNRTEVLKIGKPLPSAKLKAFGNLDIDLNDLKGKIKIISVVPKLNTPVCDKQTHKFSETNGGLDKHVDIITLSTNTMESQQEFAKKTKIQNLLFLSDMPEFHFGKNTGLLIEGLGVLRRTVIVADQNNIIRYVDFVPGGGLPNIKKALEEARNLLQESLVKG